MKLHLRDFFWLTILVAVAIMWWRTDLRLRIVDQELQHRVAEDEHILETIASANNSSADSYQRYRKQLNDYEFLTRTIGIESRSSTCFYLLEKINTNEITQQQFSDLLARELPDGISLTGCIYLGSRDGFDFFELRKNGKVEQEFRVAEGSFPITPDYPWPVAGQYIPYRRLSARASIPIAESESGRQEPPE